MKLTARQKGWSLALKLQNIILLLGFLAIFSQVESAARAQTTSEMQDEAVEIVDAVIDAHDRVFVAALRNDQRVSYEEVLTLKKSVKFSNALREEFGLLSVAEYREQWSSTRC